MAAALQRYADELTSARNDLVSQQQRAQQPAPQAQMQQAEQLLQQIERPLRSANDGIVNDALQEYARSLQRYASNQLQNGMDPITVANGMRDTINTLRNIVLTQPTDPTRNFMTDQLGEYVSALRQAIDGIGQWIETQNRPQTANLPAEVQQNIDQRNQDISNAYLNALIPNTNIEIIDQSLSEFADLLHSMSTNLYGAGFNTAEIVERLQDRIRTEITELSSTDRVMNRGLNVAEADTIRSRLNTAYGDLTEVREAYQVPNRQGPATTESITTAIQTAFTPNTGSPIADAWLSQYGDVLANQIVEFENAGNNPAEVASLVDNEIREYDIEDVRVIKDEQQILIANEWHSIDKFYTTREAAYDADEGRTFMMYR
jgi:hemoglobin-like flavoprotein